MASERISVNAGAGGGDELPPELAGVAAALERLALHERASAGPMLEERVALASRGALSEPEVAGIAAAADALGAAERASAGPALEDRLFMATRRLVVEGGAEAEREPVIVVRSTGAWMRWARPALAAAAVLTAGVTVWLAARPAAPGKSEQIAMEPRGTNEPVAEPAAEVPVTELALGGTDDLDLGPLGHFADLSSDVEGLSQYLQADWFELGLLVHEETM